MGKRRPVLETVLNSHCIPVCKACLSCAYKDVTRMNKKRFCTLRNEEVDKYGLCEHWEMSEALQQIAPAPKTR